MKAWVCPAYGDPSVLRIEARAGTEPDANEVRIRLAAAGVNFPDLLSIAGTYPIRSDPPFIPGVEGAGTVIACGPNMRRLRVGERVCWQNNERKGSFAEEAVLPETAIARVPDSVPLDIAACVPTAYGTAYFALVHRAALRPGEILVVHGASGGVGLAAVQLGKLLGATVIATGADAAKLAIVRALGADHVINVSAEPVRERILELTAGSGADVYLDPVGGDLFEASLRAIAPYGRVLVIGFTSGQFPVARANILLVKAVSVIGVNYGHYLRHSPDEARNHIEQILQWVEQGRLSPRIHARYDLGHAVDALLALTRRTVVGKCVIKMNGWR